MPANDATVESLVQAALAGLGTHRGDATVAEVASACMTLVLRTATVVLEASADTAAVEHNRAVLLEGIETIQHRISAWPADDNKAVWN